MIKIGNKIVKFDKYADGTCKVSIDCKEFEPYAPIIWLYDGDDSELVQLWFLTMHCREHEHFRRTLSIPFFCNSRMDRCKTDVDVFTLKYFAQIINAMQFNKVETFDPHSDVLAPLINNISVISPAPLVNKLLNTLPQNILIAFPDEGGMARYRGDFARPALYGIKQRNWYTQKIEKLVIAGTTDEIKGKNILIIDDICGKGTTIYYMAKQLKERGAENIYVYVSHCENTVLQPNINGKSLLDYDLITKIYTTNSIYRGNHPKIEVIHKF